MREQYLTEEDFNKLVSDFRMNVREQYPLTWTSKKDVKEKLSETRIENWISHSRNLTMRENNN